MKRNPGWFSLVGHPQQRRFGSRGVVLILLLGLVSTLGLGDVLDPYLPTNQFGAWLNLMRQSIDWAPIVRAARG